MCVRAYVRTCVRACVREFMPYGIPSMKQFIIVQSSNYKLDNDIGPIYIIFVNQFVEMYLSVSENMLRRVT